MAPPKIRKDETLVITHHGILAEFYSAGMHGFYCDVFFGPTVTGEGYAVTKRQALSEALHNAADRMLSKIFDDSADSIDTIPVPPPPSEQKP